MSDAMELIDSFTRERRFGPVAHTKWAVVRRAFERAGWHYTTAGRCAARYRAMTGCTLDEASAAFGISIATVHQAQAGLTRRAP